MAASPAGREPLLLAAFSDNDKDVRVNGALALQTWDPAAATRAFEVLIVESGGTVVRPMTMRAALAVPDDARDAALCLFNVDSPKGSRGRNVE